MHTRCVTADSVSIRHEYGVGINSWWVLCTIPAIRPTHCNKNKKVLFGRIVHNLKYTRVL